MTQAPFKPEMRAGVSASCIYLDKNLSPSTGLGWRTILDFLVEKFSAISAGQWRERMQQGKVLGQYGQLIQADTAYQPYIKIFYYREVAQETEIPFQEQILFESEHLLVVDKPHFLPVTPTGIYVQQTLLSRLKQRFNSEDISPIHRLDRETAGVMLFSKQPATRHLYHDLFQKHQVAKQYHAIAPYNPDLKLPMHYQSRMVKGEPFFRMQEVEGIANSFTSIERLEIRENLARYLLKPLTGKQHQLRVHLAALNIPILNDPFYPTFASKPVDDFSHPLQLLAHRIAFTDPVTQKEAFFNSRYTLEF